MLSIIISNITPRSFHDLIWSSQHEKHKAKKDPENAHKHKIEEEIAAAVAVGAGGYAFHEHHEKKEAKEEKKAEEGHHHRLFWFINIPTIFVLSLSHPASSSLCGIVGEIDGWLCFHGFALLIRVDVFWSL